MDDYLHLNLIAEHSEDLSAISYNTFSTSDIPHSMLREILPWWTDPNFKFHYFRPVSSLSIALDFMVWGKDPQGYHYTCLALHCLCAILVYALGLRLGLHKGYALFAALISGLHFNHLFSVSWICNRDTTLGAIFLVSSVLCFLEYLRVISSRRFVYLGISLLLFILGVLSKENVALEPAVLFFIVAVRFTHCWKGTWKSSELVPVIPFFLFSLIYSCWYALSGHGVSTGYFQVSPDKGLLGNASIIGRNLFLYLIALVYYWPPEFNLTATKWPLWALWSFLLALPVGLMLWKRNAFRSIPNLWVFLAWTLLFLVTPLCFTPLGRLLYISTIGYGLLIACLFQEILRSVQKRTWKLCLWTVLFLYFVVVPFILDSASAALLAKKGDEIHLALERALADVEKGLPEDGEIFLINVPDPVSVYVAGAVHHFHTDGKGKKVFALGNVPEVPSLEKSGDSALRLIRDKGIINLDVSFPIISLSEGREVRMPSFVVTVERIGEGKPTHVLFKFSRPLNCEAYAFLTFADGKAARIRFH